MSGDSPSCSTLRETIIRDQFAHVDFETDVLMVGVLFEYQFLISRTFPSPVNHKVSVSLEPLDPQEAAVLVGHLFGFDCDRLFLAFDHDWSRLKRRSSVSQIVATLESECLERWSDPKAPA